MEFTLVLNQPQVEQVLSALLKRPMEEVEAIVAVVRNQANTQLQAAQAAEMRARAEAEAQTAKAGAAEKPGKDVPKLVPPPQP